MSQDTYQERISGNGSAPAVEPGEISLAVSIDEANLILEGLGQLAFARVFALIGKIQRQARAQLEASTGASGEA